MLINDRRLSWFMLAVIIPGAVLCGPSSSKSPTKITGESVWNPPIDGGEGGADASLDATTEEILTMMKGGANEAYGEDLSQLNHALQAAMFAGNEGQPEYVILAALLHDIGHLTGRNAPQMGGFGAIDHEAIGAEWLQKHGMGVTVATLVRGHVLAKLYLTGTKPNYADNLSDASKETLKYQLQAISEKDMSEFRSHPLRDLMLKIRQYDEAAKETDWRPNASNNLAAYRDMLKRHLLNVQSGVVH
jgi:predicted HD phosphohydrolase